jgi:hypothetical protein
MIPSGDRAKRESDGEHDQRDNRLRWQTETDSLGAVWILAAVGTFGGFVLGAIYGIWVWQAAVAEDVRNGGPGDFLPFGVPVLACAGAVVRAFAPAVRCIAGLLMHAAWSWNRRSANLTSMSVVDLLSELDVAGSSRKHYLNFRFNPTAFMPATRREQSIWDELTAPRRHDELVQFPAAFKERTGRELGQNDRYQSVACECVLKASDERLTRQ